MAKIKLTITVNTFLDGQHQEELEDKIRDLLLEEGISGTIYNTETGNTTVAEPITVKECLDSAHSLMHRIGGSR